MRFRILQIVLNGLLFFFLTFEVVDLVLETHWRFDGRRIGSFFILLVSVACLAALVGSIRFNFQVLRKSEFHRSVSNSLLSQFYFLSWAIVLLYIATERDSLAPLIYDSHLSTHYMTIAIPDWPWLQLSPIDRSVTIQDYEILNLLAYVLLVSILLVPKIIALTIQATNPRWREVNLSLIKYQIAAGIVVLLMSALYLFASIEKLIWFISAVDFDPALLNLSNLSGFAFGLVNCVLLVAYGYCVFKDGMSSKKSTVRR